MPAIIVLARGSCIAASYWAAVYAAVNDHEIIGFFVALFATALFGSTRIKMNGDNDEGTR